MRSMVDFLKAVRGIMLWSLHADSISCGVPRMRFSCSPEDAVVLSVMNFLRCTPSTSPGSLFPFLFLFSSLQVHVSKAEVRIYSGCQIRKGKKSIRRREVGALTILTDRPESNVL